MFTHDSHGILFFPETSLTFASAPPVAGRTDGGANGSQPTQGADGSLGGGGTTTPPSSPFGGGGFLFILLLLMGFMILTTVFGGRKEKKRRAEMLSSLKRHDEVVTIGGVIGTVAEVHDDRVVLKVDESNNTKVRVTKAAIQSVLKSSGSRESSAPAAREPEKVGV